MKKNMGAVDKTIRIGIAAVIVILLYTDVLNGTLAIVLIVVALIFLLTSFFNYCPMYPLLGINTTKKEKPQ